MAGNKKPGRKPSAAMRPRVGLTPMMKGTHDGLATELHAAVFTLLHAPSVLAWNQVMKKLEAITIASAFMRRKSLRSDRDPLANALRTMLYALDASGKRHDRTGVMAVSEAEAASIKVAAAEMDAALAKIPVNVYRASVVHAAEQQVIMHANAMQAATVQTATSETCPG